MRSGFAVDRSAIIPYTAITKCKSAFVGFDYLMTVRTGYVIGRDFYDLAVIFARSDDAARCFVFIPRLMYAPKTSGNVSNMLFYFQGVVHRKYQWN